MELVHRHRSLWSLRLLTRLGWLDRVTLQLPVRCGERRLVLPTRGGRGLDLLVDGAPHLGIAYAAALAVFDGAFVDVGAHHGQSLVRWLERDPRPDRPYVGFEPRVDGVARIGELVAANRLARVKVVAAALGEAAGMARLRWRAGDDSVASLVEGFRRDDFYDRDEPVPVVRGDHAVEALGVEAVGVVKIDVEGAELEVLRGLEPVVLRHRPAILCEVLPVHDPGTESGRLRRERCDRLEALLGAWEYRIRRLDADGTRVPVEGFPTHADLGRVDHLFVPAERAQALDAALERAAAGTEAP